MSHLRVVHQICSGMPSFDHRVGGIILLGLGLGCRTVAPEGTSVGNPGKGVLRIGRGDDVRIRSAQLPVDDVRLLACGEGSWALDGAKTLDLVSGLHFGLPTDEICGLAVASARALRVEGVALNGEASFGLTLPIADFQLKESLIRGDRQVFLLGDPGWLSAEMLGIMGPGKVEIGPGDPRYSQIRAALLANVEFGMVDAETVPHEEEGQFICNEDEGDEREWDDGDEDEEEGGGEVWDCREPSEWEGRAGGPSGEGEEGEVTDTGEDDSGESG